MKCSAFLRDRAKECHATKRYQVPHEQLFEAVQSRTLSDLRPFSYTPTQLNVDLAREPLQSLGTISAFGAGTVLQRSRIATGLVDSLLYSLRRRGWEEGI